MVVYKVTTFYDSSLFVSLNPFKILAKVFSRGALESYLPRLQDVIKSEIAKWCLEPGAVDVYNAARSLTFRIAVRVLLGLQLEEDRIVYLAQIFEQLMNNLFSLPIDAPLSGLRKVRQQSLQLYLCNEIMTNSWRLFLCSGDKSQRNLTCQHGENHRGEDGAAAGGGGISRCIRLHAVQFKRAQIRVQHPGAQGTNEEDDDKTVDAEAFTPTSCFIVNSICPPCLL